MCWREGALQDPQKAGGYRRSGHVGPFGESAFVGEEGRPKRETGSAKTVSREFVMVERGAETGEKTRGEKSREKRDLG